MENHGASGVWQGSFDGRPIVVFVFSKSKGAKVGVRPLTVAGFARVANDCHFRSQVMSQSIQMSNRGDHRWSSRRWVHQRVLNRWLFAARPVDSHPRFNRGAKPCQISVQNEGGVEPTHQKKNNKNIQHLLQNMAKIIGIDCWPTHFISTSHPFHHYPVLGSSYCCTQPWTWHLQQ